jgi:pilus assembly protein Flp/PilA
LTFCKPAIRQANERCAMKSLVLRYLQDESAATAIEYALIAAGIALVIVSSVSAAGVTVKGLYQSVVDAFPGP